MAVDNGRLRQPSLKVPSNWLSNVDPFQTPGDIDAIVIEEGSDGVGRILVRGEWPGRTVRVQLSIDELRCARWARRWMVRQLFG